MKRDGYNIIYHMLRYAVVVLSALGPSTGKAGTTKPVQVINDFKISRHREGRLEWNLRAVRAVTDVEGNVEMIDAVLVLAKRDGRPGYTIRAKKASMKSDRETVYLYGGVTMSSTDGTRLETESLTWYTKKKTASSSAPVLIRKGEVSIKGTAFTFSGRDRSASIRSDITAVILTRKRTGNRKIVIRAGGPAFLRRNTVVFNGNPVVTSEDGIVIQGKKLTITLGPGNEVKEATMNNETRFQRDNMAGTCRKAMWTAATGRILLEDDVRIRWKGRRTAFIEAGRCIIFTNERRARFPGPVTATIRMGNNR